MQARCASYFIPVLVASACAFDHDAVAAGYYGPAQAGRAASAPAQPQVTAPASPPASAGSASTPSAAAGSSSSNAPEAEKEPVASPSPPGAASPSGMAAAAHGCDLSGRWLSSVHQVTDALGQLQYAHDFLYYEIEQKGDAFTIQKGLWCGNEAIGVGAFAVTADFRATWPALTRVNFKGRTGTSAVTSGGCKVEFSKWYVVRGATLPHYLDPAVPLPTAEEKATGGTPGWEDWDGDGNPGITGVVSGVVNGKIFVAPRGWTAMSGTVAEVSSKFRLSLQWDQEPNVMAYDGTPLLGSEAARAADPTLHFVEFARLSADQATGDDAAICKSIVELAPMLTPAAAGL